MPADPIPTAAHPEVPTLVLVAPAPPPQAPSASLLAAWGQALRLGRPDQAAGYRRRLEALADEEPGWEDAEWQ